MPVRQFGSFLKNLKRNCQPFLFKSVRKYFKVKIKIKISIIENCPTTGRIFFDKSSALRTQDKKGGLALWELCEP